MTAGDQLGAATVVEIVRRRASLDGDRRALAFVRSDGGESTLSYRQLDQGAVAAASRLVAAGARPGDRAILLYPPGLDFVTAFLGCLYAGVIAVPSLPPRRGRRDARLASIALSATPAFVLSTDGLAGGATDLPAELTRATWLATDADPEGSGAFAPPEIGPDGVAFLQFTSGSTSDPKGVIVTHANLCSNIAAASELFDLGPDDVAVSWLPLHHDMGLIGGVLYPLGCGFPVTLISPASFLQRPARWLELISGLHATVSVAPSFGYELATARVRDDVIAGLDLSSWRCALNGAEPVRHEVMEAFSSRFAPAGFRAEAFAPCYGLAEATLVVSGVRAGEQPEVCDADADALGRGVLTAAADGAPRRTLVGSGRPAPGVEVVIVDPDTPQSTTEDWPRRGDSDTAARRRLAGLLGTTTGDRRVLRRVARARRRRRDAPSQRRPRRDPQRRALRHRSAERPDDLRGRNFLPARSRDLGRRQPPGARRGARCRILARERECRAARRRP